MNKNEQHTDQPGKEFNPIPWIAFALFALGVATLAGLQWNRTVTVGEVRFEGHHFVSEEELKEIDIPKGINPDSIRLVDLIDKLETITYVKQAEIRIEPSGNLNIHIRERQPIALLADGAYKVYIDTEGVKLPLIPDKAVDVPILYGFDGRTTTDTLQSDAFVRTKNFLIAMQNNPVCNATISEVAWTEAEGIVALSHENGVKLLFGKEDFPVRLKYWEAFYADVIRQKGIHRMQSVDMRYKGQIVTREG